MTETRKKISPNYLKEKGWNEKSEIYVKIPYPFGLKWHPSQSKFEIVDRYFYDIHVKAIYSGFIETEEGYEKATKEVLAATQHADKENIRRFRTENVVLSFKTIARYLLDKIRDWDPTVQQNQIDLFIEMTFGDTSITSCEELEDFLEKPFKTNGEVRTLDHLKSRLNDVENEHIKEKLKSIIQTAKLAFKDIDDTY